MLSCSVQTSVRLSVTLVYCIKTSKVIFEPFPPCSSSTVLVFAKRHGNIPTGTP